MARGQYREFITINGKRYEVTASTPEKLKEKIDKKLAEHKSECLDGTISVRDWANIWYDTYKKGKMCNRAYAATRQKLDKHILPYIGNMRIKDVTPVNIQAVVSNLSKYKYDYTKGIISIIKQLFAVAVDNGLIKSNPAERVKNPSRNFQENKRILTEEERSHILKLCETHWAGLFIKMILYCGLRPSEACVVRWSDIDLKNKTLSVNKALKSDKYIGEPKTQAGERTVFIPEVFVDDLKKAKQNANPFDYVCLSSKGLPISTANKTHLWESFKRALHIEMGGEVYHRALVAPLKVSPDLTLYTFRRTYCSDLQTAGVPINVAKYLMGHTNIHITADIYTKLSEDSVIDAKKSFDTFLKTIK